jgi:hypothetical protein
MKRETQGLPDEVVQLFRAGNPKCKYKINQKIKKITDDPVEDDIHRIGHLGIITGSFFREDVGECYFVHFEGDPHETFLAGNKKIGPAI